MIEYIAIGIFTILVFDVALALIVVFGAKLIFERGKGRR